ncbi:MAG: flagellar basal body-associated FliL family protein [candidate division Zixibacteria bacterium]|nr:flagellar basal body-associated FliL family protein [candidate division Zixibacteria bacterium]
MANEDEKTMIESDDTGVEETPKATPVKAGRRRLFLFGGVGLGAVVIGIALTAFVIKPLMSGSAEDDSGPTRVAQSQQQKEEKPKKEPNKPTGDRKSGGKDESYIYSIQDIVINPAGTGGSRFLSVSFGFELESAKLVAQFEEREPIIRDALITILSSKTIAQLTDAKQKEVVRFQIKKRIGQLMRTDDLAGVYYTDFVLQ